MECDSNAWQLYYSNVPHINDVWAIGHAVCSSVLGRGGVENNRDSEPKEAMSLLEKQNWPGLQVSAITLVTCNVK